MAAFAVAFGAGGDFHQEGDAAAGDVSENAHVQEGAKIVGVGDEGIAEPAFEKGVEQAGGLEGIVDVGMARGAPFQRGILGPVHGCTGLQIEFGDAVLTEGER